MSVDAGRLRDLTLDLVRVESPTGETRAAADLYAARLEELGMEVEVQRDVFPATPTVIGRLRGTRPGPRVVLNGHLDTVPIPHAEPRVDGDAVRVGLDTDGVQADPCGARAPAGRDEQAIAAHLPPVVERIMNVYFVEGEDGVTVFDAGVRSMARQIQSVGRAMGGIARIVLGHAHPDHRGAAARVDAPVWCHEAEVEYAEADDGQPYTDFRALPVLAETGCLGPHSTVVHATHADSRELDLLANSGARVCLCPTTEANLGDGFAPVLELTERGIGICIGSDSNVRIDPLEELREIEGIARRQTGRRGVIGLGELMRFGTDEGAAALGLERWPEAEVDLGHRSLEGVEVGDVPAALVFGCAADVFAG